MTDMIDYALAKEYNVQIFLYISKYKIDTRLNTPVTTRQQK